MNVQKVIMVMLFASMLVGIAAADNITLSKVPWEFMIPMTLEDAAHHIVVSDQNRDVIYQKIKEYQPRATDGVFAFKNGTLRQIIGRLSESSIGTNYNVSVQENETVWKNNIVIYRFVVDNADTKENDKITVLIFYRDGAVIGVGWGDDIKVIPTYIPNTKVVATSVTFAPNDNADGGGGGSGGGSGGSGGGGDGPADPGPTG